jgi:hypothetical protein
MIRRRVWDRDVHTQEKTLNRTKREDRPKGGSKE